MEKRLFYLKCLRVLALFAVLSLLAISVNAQPVTGKITDESGVPLVGVNISEKGTNNGTLTNKDGQYNLSVTSQTATLIFTYFGFETQEIAVNGQTIVDIVMKTSEELINEVIVVGYGTMKKSDVSGSSVTVKSEDITSNVGANIDAALQGKVAGVNIVNTSGQPGAAVSVKIRGQSTLNQASQPLYIIDGVPIQNVSQSGHDVGLGDNLGNGSSSTFSGLSSVNPDDILTIEVLKDASATAIYGSRAANGVVLITTKSGSQSKTVFNYNFSYGIQEQMTRIKMMNLREFAEFSNDYAAETDGRDPRVELLDPTILGEGTNWQEGIFQKAPVYSHQLSASGGNEKLKFFVSGGYFNQQGTVIGSNFDRFTTRVNLDADLKKWLRMGTSLSFANFKDRIGLTNSTEGIISVALLTSPDVPIYNTDGTYAGDDREGSPGRVNAIGKALEEINELKRTNVRGTYWTEFIFMPELKLRTELSTDLLYTNAYIFEPTYKYGKTSKDANFSSRQFSQDVYWEFKNYLTYTKTFGKHSINAMIGQETSEWSHEYIRGTSSGLPSNDVHEPALGDPDTYVVSSATGSGARVSFFGRAYYGYSDKYNLTYTYRQDGSSNFGPENRWAPFHSFALSWRLINEDFMDFAKPTLSNMKLRLGWGQVGNDNVPGYRWGASIAQMPTGLGVGYKQTNLANPYIHWEKQQSWNFGLDLGFLNNRINVVAEYYIKRSKDMLMEMQLPSYMGTSGNASSKLSPPLGNFGEIENKGMELTISALPLKGEFNWDVELQITSNKNKLIALQGTDASGIAGKGQWDDVVALSEIGQPLYSFYGYKVAGIYQNKEDLLNSPKPKEYPKNGDFVRNGLWVGDIKYQDLSGPDGTPDGVIDEYDQTNIGSPAPKFSFGINNKFTWKNFELTVFLTGSYGNKALNYVGIGLGAMESGWDNQLQNVVDRTKLEPIDPDKTYPYVNAYGNPINNWYNDVDNIQVANPGSDIPRAISGDPANNTRISDRYIEDASYLRLKTINLAYNIPLKYLSRINIQNLRIYGNIQNAYTFTKYTGFDPEIGTSQASDFVMGLDNGRYPSPRIYTFGLNVTF